VTTGNWSHCWRHRCYYHHHRHSSLLPVNLVYHIAWWRWNRLLVALGEQRAVGAICAGRVEKMSPGRLKKEVVSIIVAVAFSSTSSSSREPLRRPAFQHKEWHHSHRRLLRRHPHDHHYHSRVAVRPTLLGKCHQGLMPLLQAIGMPARCSSAKSSLAWRMLVCRVKMLSITAQAKSMYYPRITRV
jgi:hypothetical protein